MLKLKLQYSGHLMRRVDSLEKTLMLGGIGGVWLRDQRLSETQLNMTLLGSEHSLLIRTKFRSGRAKTLSVPSSALPALPRLSCTLLSSARFRAHLGSCTSVPQKHIWEVKNCMSLGGVGGGFHVFCCQCFEPQRWFGL